MKAVRYTFSLIKVVAFPGRVYSFTVEEPYRSVGSITLKVQYCISLFLGYPLIITRYLVKEVNVNHLKEFRFLITQFLLSG